MQIYRFASFEFNTQTLTLTQNGEPVPLRPKTGELLALFLSRPNDLQTKADLLATVWQDSHVSDSVLFQTISELRKALDTQSRDCGFIRNLKGQGYLWIYGDVEVIDAEQPEGLPLPKQDKPFQPEGEPQSPTEQTANKRRPGYLGLAAVALLILFVAYYLILPGSPSNTLQKQSASLNVKILPFELGPGIAPDTRVLALPEIMAHALDHHGRILTDIGPVYEPEEDLDREAPIELREQRTPAFIRCRLEQDRNAFSLQLTFSTGENIWTQQYRAKSIWLCARAATYSLRQRLAGVSEEVGEPLLEDSGELARLWGTAQAAYLEGEFSKAAVAYQRALMMQPEQVGLKLDLALALARSGRLDDARTLMEKAYDQAQLNGSFGQSRACMDGLARLAEICGDYEEALCWRRRIDAETVMRTMPFRWYDRFRLALTLQRCGRIAEADSYFTLCEPRATKDRRPELTCALAKTRGLGLGGEWTQARDNYRKLQVEIQKLKDDQLPIHCRLNLALAWIKTGAREEADKVLATILADPPARALEAQVESLTLLGSAYLDVGAQQQGLSCLNRAEQLLVTRTAFKLRLELAFWLARAHLNGNREAGLGYLRTCLSWRSSDLARSIHPNFDPADLQALARAFAMDATQH